MAPFRGPHGPRFFVLAASALQTPVLAFTQTGELDSHRFSVHPLCMASKTISLEIDAYERLKAARLHHESFSQTVRRIVPPPAKHACDLLARAKSGKWG